MKKKVLLTSAAAVLAVLSATAPVFAETVVKSETDERGITTVTYDDGTTKVFYNDGVSDEAPNGVPSYARDYTATSTQGQPVTVKTKNTNKQVRVTVLDGGGRPVPGATIDFMLNGVSIGSAVTDQSGDAVAPRLFNKGEVVEFRVGTTANDFKELVTATGSVTVSDDMFTNGSVTLPYKLDDRSATINSNSTPVDQDATQPDATKPSVADQAEKANEAAKKAGVTAKANQKALPKTHAVK